MSRKIIILSSLISVVVAWWVFAQSASDDLDALLDELLAEEDLALDQDSQDDQNEPDVDQPAVNVPEQNTDNSNNENTDGASNTDTTKPDWETHDSAEEILDMMDDDQRAYVTDVSVQVDNIQQSSADIITTKATYEWQDVQEYRVYYSEKTLSSQKLDLIEDKVIEAKEIPWDDENIQLTLTDLKPDTMYYVVISPIHPTDPTNEPLTMVTDEISFRTQWEMQQPTPASWNEDDNTQQPQQPVETSWPWPNERIFNNVSYTNTDNSVTLKWNNSIQWVQRVEVHLRHQWESTYTNIWTPQFWAGTFTFNVDKSGNFFLKLRWLNENNQSVWREHIQTVKIDSIQQPVQNPEPVVVNPPKVWPATDLMIWVMIMWVLIYLANRFRRARES